jgi:hypothetical protein
MIRLTLMIIPESEFLLQLLLHYSPAMFLCGGQIMSPPSSLVPGSVPWRVLIMTIIGTSIICAESVVFHRFDYIFPVYNTLKLIGSILPPIQSSPRPMYPKPKSKSKSNTNKSSSGRHLCKYFARKQQLSKKTIISPGSDYYCSSHIRTAT